MSRALARVARHVDRDFESLAVTRIARRENPFHVLVATVISLRTKDENVAAGRARGSGLALGDGCPVGRVDVVASGP